jgi:hypothetical protein
LLSQRLAQLGVGLDDLQDIRSGQCLFEQRHDQTGGFGADLDAPEGLHLG